MAKLWHVYKIEVDGTYDDTGEEYIACDGE